VGDRYIKWLKTDGKYAKYRGKGPTKRSHHINSDDDEDEDDAEDEEDPDE
jgi:hypothetical protein